MDDNHVAENRRHWEAMAHIWVAPGERAWDAVEPRWGIWAAPERELQVLPVDMSGLRAIELGCGTGYVSGWMRKRGAVVVGIDNSEAQLRTARRLAAQHGVSLELLHGNAERVPYPDSSFDFAISEYGAATWCDPYLWIPEACRLLRSGGHLVFLGAAPLAALCTPPSGATCEPRLHRSYFGMHRMDWTGVEIDPGGVEFNLPVSAWLRLFRESGFEVLDYLELQAPEGAADNAFVSADWARRWPAEQVWKLRKST